MKVLFYGSNGWIGSQMTELFLKASIDFEKGKSRVDDVKSLKEEIEQVQPTHVVSFIGRTHGKIGEKCLRRLTIWNKKVKCMKI